MKSQQEWSKTRGRENNQEAIKLRVGISTKEHLRDKGSNLIREGKQSNKNFQFFYILKNPGETWVDVTPYQGLSYCYGHQGNEGQEICSVFSELSHTLKLTYNLPIFELRN